MALNAPLKTPLTTQKQWNDWARTATAGTISLTDLTPQPTANGQVLSSRNGSVAWTRPTGAISLLDYINSATFKQCKLSSPLNFSASSISTVAGSNVITGGSWSSSDVGSSIVVLTEGTADSFQSVIVSYQSASQITLQDAADVTASTRFAYWGSDATTAIDNALTDAKAANKALYIPAGAYFYNGAGLSGWRSPVIYGDSSTTSIIYLGKGKYFIDANEYWYSCHLTDVGYFGGAGAFRNRYSAANVTVAPFEIARNFFRDYSVCAVSFESTDMPYDYVTGNYFQGQNRQYCIGYAMQGQGPGNLSFNTFYLNRYHAKFGNGGIGRKIIGNDFIQGHGEVTPGSYQCASVWLIPNVSSNNASIGLTFDSNKFGTENLDALDCRILLADTTASSGSNYFGSTTPLTSMSTGYIGGLSFTENNLVAGGTPNANPLFYSYVQPANFRGNRIAGNFQGTLPGYVVQFDAGATVVNDYTSQGTAFGPFNLNGFAANNMLLSNVAGLGNSFDPNGDFGYWDYTVSSPWTTGASPCDYTKYLTTLINSFTIIGGGSKATITDPTGGSDAITFTMGAVNGGNEIYSALASTPTAGLQCWMDVYLRQGSSGTPLTTCVVSIADGFSSPYITTKTINLSTIWRRYRIPFVLRSVPTHAPPNFQIQSVTGTAIGQTLDIAMPRVYAASEPTTGGLFTTAPQFSGPNTTGAGSAAFGANCPASTLTAPYTWVQVQVADGSKCWIPAFK